MARRSKCIFCGTEGVLTKEHIWSDWLKNYIPKDLLNYKAGDIILGRDGKPISEKRRIVGGDPKSRRVRCVCGSATYLPKIRRKGCNDGWMKDLQDLVKPIVLPLIRGESCEIRSKADTRMVIADT